MSGPRPTGSDYERVLLAALRRLRQSTPQLANGSCWYCAGPWNNTAKTFDHVDDCAIEQADDAIAARPTRLGKAVNNHDDLRTSHGTPDMVVVHGKRMSLMELVKQRDDLLAALRDAMNAIVADAEYIPNESDADVLGEAALKRAAAILARVDGVK